MDVLEELINALNASFIIGVDKVIHLSCYHCGIHQEIINPKTIPGDWVVTTISDPYATTYVVSCSRCVKKHHNFVSEGAE